MYHYAGSKTAETPTSLREPNVVDELYEIVSDFSGLPWETSSRTNTAPRYYSIIDIYAWRLYGDDGLYIYRILIFDSVWNPSISPQINAKCGCSYHRTVWFLFRREYRPHLKTSMGLWELAAKLSTLLLLLLLNLKNSIRNPEIPRIVSTRECWR